MRKPELETCLYCDEKLQPVAHGRANYVAECNSCGFFATTRDVARADFLANFYPLPDIRVAAKRIADRAPLKYADAKLPRAG